MERPSGSIKDSALLLAIISASGYGAGWLSRTIMLSNLGVGLLTVSRESAFSAAVSFFLWAAPMYVGSLFVVYARKDVATNRMLWMPLVLVLLLLVAGLEFGMMLLLTGNVKVSTSVAFVMGPAMAAISLGMTLWFIRTRADATEVPLHLDPDIALFSIGAGCLLLVLIVVHGLTVLPSARPAFGGHPNASVLIKIDEPPATLKVLLVDSDDKNVLLKDEQGKYLRLPLERVKAIRPR